MYCAYCGAPCNGDEMFCPGCGSPLQAEGGMTDVPLSVPPAPEEGPPSPPEEAQVHTAALPALRLPRLSPRARRVCLALLVLLAAAGAMLALRPRPAPDFSLSRQHYGLVASGDAQALYRDGEEVVLPDGDTAWYLLPSYTGEGALLTGASQLYALWGGTSLPLHVEESRLLNLACSMDGRVVCYTTDGDGLLYFDAARNQAFCLWEDGAALLSGPVLSPSGDTLSFSAAGEDGEATLFLSRDGGEPRPVMTDAVPAAVSDGGEYLYYSRSASDPSNGQMDDLYVRSGADSILLASQWSGDLVLNRDGSEAIYTTPSCGVFLTRQGSGGILLDRDLNFLSPIPPQASTFSIMIFSQAWYFDVTHLTGRFCVGYGSGETPCYLTEGGEAQSLEFDLLRRSLASPDGQTLYCLDSTHLFRVRAGHLEEPEPLLPDTLVDDFALSPDGKSLFVRAMNGELYRLIPGREAELLDSGLLSWQMSPDRKQLWYQKEEGGLLYACTWSGAPAALMEADRYSPFCGGMAAYASDGRVWYAPSGGALAPLTDHTGAPQTYSSVIYED